MQMLLCHSTAEYALPRAVQCESGGVRVSTQPTRRLNVAFGVGQVYNRPHRYCAGGLSQVVQTYSSVLPRWHGGSVTVNQATEDWHTEDWHTEDWHTDSPPPESQPSSRGGRSMAQCNSAAQLPLLMLGHGILHRHVRGM